MVRVANRWAVADETLVRKNRQYVASEIDGGGLIRCVDRNSCVRGQGDKDYVNDGFLGSTDFPKRWIKLITNMMLGNISYLVSVGFEPVQERGTISGLN